MNVMQIVAVRLKQETENKITKQQYDQITEWLKQWTCITNFQAILAESREKALEECRKDLKEKLLPYWLKDKIMPSMFEFEVSEQTVVNNRFWMSSKVVWSHWHSI